MYYLQARGGPGNLFKGDVTVHEARYDRAKVRKGSTRTASTTGLLVRELAMLCSIGLGCWSHHVPQVPEEWFIVCVDKLDRDTEP